MAYNYPSTLDAGGGVPGYGRSKSPAPYMHSPQLGGPQPPAPIQAGDMTYTTSIGPDGRPIYHLFRAESASYRSPQGLIHGIQWVAIDPLYDEPEDIRPASVDWIQQWARNRNDPREEKMWKEWIKMEEKRRKREERDYGRQRDYDKDYRRSSRSRSRTRRPSFSSNAVPVDPYRKGPLPQPDYPEASVMTGDYLNASPGDPLGRQRRSVSRGPVDPSDIDRRMRDMDLNDPGRRISRRKSFSYDDGQGGGYPANADYGNRGQYREPDEYDYRGGQLTAAGGPGYPPGHILGLSPGGSVPINDRRASPNYSYSSLPVDRPRSPYSAGVAAPRPRSPYINPSAQILDRPRSPYANPQALERPRSAYGNHPQALDRPRSPYAADSNYSYSGVTGPGYVDVNAQQRGALINPAQQGIMFPEAFNRLPSFGRGSLAPFEPFLITWLDNLAKDMPRLPAVLVPHDITHQDWIKFMSDVTSVWLGQTRNPYPSSAVQPRRSTIASSVIDSWNSAFFLPRRIEVVLIKGRTRYSGPGAGRSDPRLSRAIEATLHGDLDDDDDDDDLTDFDEYDEEEGYDTGYGFYGSGSTYRLPGDDRWMAKASTARRRWIERARADRRTNNRRERQRRERITKKKYSLYCMTTV